MATKIGFQDGIQAAVAALRELAPGRAAAWSKLEETLELFKAGVNEHEDRLDALEGRPAPAPFPHGEPS